MLTCAERRRKLVLLDFWNDTVAGFHKRLVEVKSQPTADSYVHAVKLWEQFLAEKGVVDLSLAHPGLLDDFARWCVKRGLMPQTIASRCTGVKSWLVHLRRLGHKVPDFLAPDLPKVTTKEPKVLTFVELSGYLRRANMLHEPVRTALMMMPLSGLRSDEVVRISLSSTKVVDGWLVFTFIGKGGKQRSVPLLKQGNATMRSYLTGWRAQFKSKHPNDWMFPGHHAGKHMSTRTLRKWAETISIELGIPELSPHVLRKTYTTILDTMGVSPLVIAQLVGHSKLTTTSKHYVHHEIGSLVSSLAKVQLPDVLVP